MPHHLKALMETDIIPMIDQIEFHPGWMQKETVKYCKENTIQVEAWSPLGNGRVLNHPNLQQIAQKYGKTVAQNLYSLVSAASGAAIIEIGNTVPDKRKFGSL